ncbi:hypothetical protein ACFV1L_11980 [Kitasatospora sp. NPDC059646]|uniref:hypothetical protein n=1 Tax=Kitasatospora sp. NPDC059646 TaxID=3346893 RepID=UPI0036A39CAB
MAVAVLAAALTGCTATTTPPPGPAPAPTGAASPPATAGAPGPHDPAQESAQLRAVLAAPQQPFSAILSVQLTDGPLSVRRQGAINVAGDAQTGALGAVSVQQDVRTQTYLTVTRDAVYTRTGDRPWVTSARSTQPLLADHRPMAEALLRADPGSFHGMAKIRTLRGGTGFHLVGRLPVAELAGALDADARAHLAQHQVPDCATDLLIDGAGRLSELTLSCEANGYAVRSTTGLAEFGPVADTPPPADL